MAILLAGCGKEETPSVWESENFLSIDADGETKSYIAEIWDTGITPERQPLSNSFVLTEDFLYYVDKTEGSPTEIGGVSLWEQSQPPKRIIQLKDGYIEAVTLAEETGGERFLLLAGMEETGVPFLAAYTREGSPLWKRPYEGESREQMVIDLAQGGDGGFFALCAEQLLIFDPEGVYQGAISCPGECYIDICAVPAGDVYVTYRDGQRAQPVLAAVGFRECRLEGELSIPGSGRLGPGSEGNLLFLDNGNLYSFSPQKQRGEKLTELARHDLTEEQIQAMAAASTGEVRLVSWEILSYDKPIQMARLKETTGERATEDGKQILTWLVAGIKPVDADQIVAAFNRQSRDYRVVIEQVSLAGLQYSSGATQFDIQEGIYMCLNTRLLAAESADLISFTACEDMERYLTRGYLEDLTPYIARSEQIKREDYLEQALECYASGDALYSITPVFYVETLMGRASDLGEQPGWTVEELLDWLEQHPDAVTKEGMTRENVLDFCLRGTLDAYLDRDAGTCDFEGEEFQKLMERIGGLTMDSAAHWEDWSKQLEEKKPVLEQNVIGGFSSCNAWENLYGEPLVYKGYPSLDGTPCYFLEGDGLGILSRSGCKEGAYAFWEYDLQSRSQGGDHYYTQKEAYADSLARAADEQYAYTKDGKMMYRKQSETQAENGEEEEELEWFSRMSDEQREKQLPLLEYARIDTLENQKIRNMIGEEASGYFAGAKDLTDTCRIIQSKVSLFLAENR